MASEILSHGAAGGEGENVDLLFGDVEGIAGMHEPCRVGGVTEEERGVVDHR